MAKAIDKIQLVLNLKGFSEINGLGKDFDKLRSTVTIADKDVDEFVNTLRQVRKETKLSKNAFQGQIDALKRTKDNVAIGSAEYKKLSAAIRETEKDMKRLIATQGGGGGRFGGTFGKMSVGAQAAGGAAIGAAALLPGALGTAASAAEVYERGKIYKESKNWLDGIQLGLANASLFTGWSGVGEIIATPADLLNLGIDAARFGTQKTNTSNRKRFRHGSR